MNKYAIIAAGGSGQRMGSAVPKQFLEIHGKPILWYAVKVFVEAFDAISIIVVAPAEHLVKAKQVCEGFPNVQFVTGGETRFHSVKNGLSLVTEPSIVFVHDAVRCLVTKDLLNRCYNQAVQKGSAVPSIGLNDSARVVDDDKHTVIDRNAVRIIQTPQVFKSNLILPAFEIAFDEKFTDEASVVEAAGGEVHLIEGELSNIKITQPLDLLVAERLLDQNLNA